MKSDSTAYMNLVNDDSHELREWQRSARSRPEPAATSVTTPPVPLSAKENFGPLTPGAVLPDAASPGRVHTLAPPVLPPRILVVDDDEGVRVVSAAILRRAAFRVSCAQDGEAAWDALRSDPFDLMITDHNMPRLTGVELLRRVRAAALKLPVIMISANVPWNEPDLDTLLQPGTALGKPFSVDQLLTCVRGFLFPGTDTYSPFVADRRRA